MAERTVSVRLLALTSTYQAAMARAAASTRALSATMAQTEISSRRTTQALTGMGLGSKVALGATGLAAYGLAKGLMSSVNAAIDFESSFAGVRKTVDATEEEFEALEQGMRRLATEIPVSVNELNRIGELGGQLGVAKESLVDFTKTVALMGVTTDLSVEEAATSFAQFANITQMPQSQFENLGSAIVALGNAGASTEQELAEFGKRIAGAGEIAGFTEGEILGIGNAVASLGVNAEAGGTAVQKVMLKITESVALGDEKLQGFADAAGMSADEFVRTWEADPAKAFVAFTEGLGKAGTGAIGILKELGLTDQRLTRAFLSLGASGDVLRESIDLGNESFSEANALQEEAAKRFETTASKLQLANNQIEEAKIAFGEGLAVALGDTAEAFTETMLANDRMMDSLHSSFSLMGLWAGQVDGGAMSMDDFRTKVEALLGTGEHSLDTLREFASATAAIKEAMAGGATVGEAFDQVLGEAAGTTDEFGGAQSEAEGSVEGVTGAIEDQITALDRLKGASGLLGIQDAVLGIRDAQMQLSESRRALTELENDGKKGTVEYSEALQGQRQAALGALRSQLGLGEAVASLREKVETGEVSMRDAVSLVRHFGEEAGLSDRFVDGLIGKVKGLTEGLDDLPREKKPKVTVEGIDAANSAVNGLRSNLLSIERTYTALMAVKHVTYPAPEPRALGGPVLPGRDYIVGERGPELLRMGSARGAVIPNRAIGAGGTSSSEIEAATARGVAEGMRRGGLMEISVEADGQKLTSIVSTGTARNKVLLGGRDSH